jgi:hypothetical protein
VSVLQRINVPKISEDAAKYVENVLPKDQITGIMESFREQFGNSVSDSDLYANSVAVDMMKRFQVYVVKVVQQTADLLQDQFAEALKTRKPSE